MVPPLNCSLVLSPTAYNSLEDEFEDTSGWYTARGEPSPEKERLVRENSSGGFEFRMNGSSSSLGNADAIELHAQLHVALKKSRAIEDELEGLRAREEVT
jgi:hypothetical protein